MIDRSTVEKVLHLARLELAEAEVARLCTDLGAILQFVESLESLPLDDVPPLTHAGRGSDIYREDEVGPTLPRDAALANAPERKDGHFKVPRVIEEPS